MEQFGLFDKMELQGKSQAEKVFWWLEKHGSITNAQCHELFGIRHCPSVIRDIKKKLLNGRYEIVNKPAKGCNRFGEPTHWEIYTLVEKPSNLEMLGLGV